MGSPYVGVNKCKLALISLNEFLTRVGKFGTVKVLNVMVSYDSGRTNFWGVSTDRW